MSVINQIPKPYHTGFKDLAEMEEPTFIELKDGLSLSSFTSSVKKIAEITAMVKSLPQKTIEKIFYSVGGLVFILEKGSTVDEIVEDVCNLLEKESIVDFKNNSKENFISRLSILLKSEKLYYAAKASTLKEESNNVFIQSKVITDIRPIYSTNIDETPKKGIVIHNLHIHYSSEGEGGHKDIYFALDSEELKELKEVLLRAEKKEISLKDIFSKSNIENLS
jgi:hypothetical protein